MNAAQAANAPVEITIGDKHYLVSQLTRADRAELDRWAQGRIVEVARLGLNGATTAERREIMGLAFERAASATWSSANGEGNGTLTKIVRLLWQYVKARSPGVTQDDILEALEANPEQIATIFETIDLLYHRPGDENPTIPAETPAMRTT